MRKVTGPVDPVDLIADEELPKFTPEAGVETEGFAEFCSQRGLTEEQVAKLVARLERKHYGKTIC